MSKSMNWKIAAQWLHAAYDRPPQMPEVRAMLEEVDALAFPKAASPAISDAAPGAHPAPTAQPVAIPKGWKLVPIKANREMLNTWALKMPTAVFTSPTVDEGTQVLGWSAVDAIWRDMLAAAPAAPMLNGLTASEPSYRDKAQKLLDAAHDFWQSSSPRVAVRWLSASDDALVIFTRGEYRETLMSNIDKLPGESVTWLIGEADEDRPELRYGQRAASETAETASVASLTEPERMVTFDDRPMLRSLAAAEHRMRNPPKLQFEDEAKPDDLITVAHVDCENGAGTLTLAFDQLGDLAVLVGEDEETYTVRIAPMKRADFEALGEFDGF